MVRENPLNSLLRRLPQMPPQQPQQQGGLEQALQNPNNNQTPPFFFQGDVTSGIGRAKLARKLVFVYIFEQNQNESTIFRQNLIQNPQIIELVQRNCICLEFEFNSTDGIQFRTQFPITNTPSICIVDPQRMNLVINLHQPSNEDIISELRKIFSRDTGNPEEEEEEEEEFIEDVLEDDDEINDMDLYDEELVNSPPSSNQEGVASEYIEFSPDGDEAASMKTRIKKLRNKVKSKQKRLDDIKKRKEKYRELNRRKDLKTQETTKEDREKRQRELDRIEWRKERKRKKDLQRKLKLELRRDREERRRRMMEEDEQFRREKEMKSRKKKNEKKVPELENEEFSEDEPPPLQREGISKKRMTEKKKKRRKKEKKIKQQDKNSVNTPENPEKKKINNNNNNGIRIRFRFPDGNILTNEFNDKIKMKMKIIIIIIKIMKMKSLLDVSF